MPLTIECAELFVVRMPLVHPFETSFGVQAERATVVVRLAAGDLVGWGESPVSADPGYSYETVETALHVLSDFLLPVLPGWAAEGDDLPEPFHRVNGHPMAKAGVVGALSDLRARAQGRSLSAFLGGSRQEVPVGVSVGIQPTVDALVERIRRFVSQGYGRVKVKIRPGWDREVLAAVRKAFPDLALWADANQAYARPDEDLLASFDEFELGLLEQPFAAGDLAAHANLARRCRTPLCLDESVETLGHFRTAHACGALGVLNMKGPRVGGHGAAVAIHNAAREAGIPAWCGGLLETGIGRLHNIALASLPHFTLPGDISATDRYFARDLVDPPVTLGPDSTLAVPQGPGLGHAVDTDALEHFTVRRAAFH